MASTTSFSEDYGETDLPPAFAPLALELALPARASVRIAPHFVAGEFDCRDGTKVPAYSYPQLRRWAEVWGEPLRREFGAVTVLSGFRTPVHNAAVGGAVASWHVYSALERMPRPTRRGKRGVAVDVRCEAGTAAEWARWARKQRARTPGLSGAGRGGIGTYARLGFVHLDTGPLRDWQG